MNILELRTIVYLSSNNGISKGLYFQQGHYLYCIPITAKNRTQAARYRLAGIALKYLHVKGFIVESRTLNLTSKGFALIAQFEAFCVDYFEKLDADKQRIVKSV